MAFISLLKKQTQNLAPVYFALVMATGIVSIACHLLQLEFLSNFFFYLNHLQYALLLLLLGARMMVYPRDFTADFTNDSTGPGFLTFVAGSCILGVQYCLLKQVYLPAIIFLIIGLVAWIIIVYAFLLMMITKAYKPNLENGLNGGWLLLVVSTQSLSILGTLLSNNLVISPVVTLFLTLAAYLLGIFFYLLLIPLIFLRLTFNPIKAKEFTPPYWVLMGAAAITTLSAATLIQAINKTFLFADLVPVLKALSLFTWIVASWWIPLLIILELWRHLYKKIPLKYEATYWDTIFYFRNVHRL
ncbi:MAG: tellurite resistance/C4-dicarboxylate transporter family protein [Janthinobacterium lividum]